MADLAQVLAARHAAVRSRVDDACRAAGRDPAEVAILPVSKTFAPDVLRAAMRLGWRRFGENRPQEIRDKARALVDLAPDLVMIGHLQTNKVREVARHASELQSLDRLELAQALQRRLETEGRALDVLVQVKTALEPSKTGLAPEQLLPFLEQLADLPNLVPRGLMTLATQTDDADAVRACFRRLRALRDAAAERGHALPTLSMGMSGDFPLAIAEGATEVRIGSALFGERSTGDS